MIDIEDEDIVAQRRASDGRFVIFLRADHVEDVDAGAPPSWWGVALDVLGDGHTVLVRLDERAMPEGWTALDLLDVALARPRAQRLLGEPHAEAIAQRLLRARAAEEARRGGLARGARLRFGPGHEGSSYAWGSAVLGGGPELLLCPDPAGREGGVTPEQLLLVLERLFADARERHPREPRLRAAHLHVRAALDLEVRRAAALRGGTTA